MSPWTHHHLIFFFFAFNIFNPKNQLQNSEKKTLKNGTKRKSSKHETAVNFICKLLNSDRDPITMMEHHSARVVIAENCLKGMITYPNSNGIQIFFFFEDRNKYLKHCQDIKHCWLINISVAKVNCEPSKKALRPEQELCAFKVRQHRDFASAR